MPVKRRTLLAAAAAGLGLAATTTAAGCAPSAGPGSGSQPAGPAALRMAWWGNQARTDLTNEVIASFQTTTPGTTITGESIEWDSYWDRLATQTAANDAPDVIQMDLKYLREYGDRGALLDLDGAGVDTSAFAEGTLDAGRTDDGLMGVNAGVNALFIAANPAAFEKAGVELPDDETWTWDEWAALSAEITAKGGGIIGSTDFTLYDLAVWMFMRQKGKDLYAADGIGFDAADAQEWFELSQKLEQTKAIPPIGQATEDITAPLADRLFTKGQTAMSVFWSNQVRSIEAAAKREITMLRFPSMTGKAADSKVFLNTSMMWSVPARTENEEATIAFVNYLVNDPAAAAILGAERGMPANTAMREAILGDLEASDKKAADYLTAIEPILAPASPAPPVGLGDISLPQTRYLEEVRFGRTDPAAAAKAYVDELNGLIKR